MADSKIIDPISSKMVATRKRRKLTVGALGELLGIPSGRIYKWEAGKSSPKFGDRQKLENWLALEDSITAREEMPSGEPMTELEHSSNDSSYVADLKQQIKELKQDKADLKREKDTLYNLLQVNLSGLDVTVKITQAQLKALIKWMVEQSASQGDPNAATQNLAKINTLVAEFLPAGDGMGKQNEGI